MNKLYFGDNLDILREHIATESVDLIYLGSARFNSKRDYSVLFKTPKGHESDAQITAFEDSWHWGEQAEREFSELEQSQHTDVAEMMIALRKFLKEMLLCTLPGLLFFIATTPAIAQDVDAYWAHKDSLYTLTDIRPMLAAERQYADSAEHTDQPQTWSRIANYRFVATYLGKSRPLDSNVNTAMHNCYKIMVGNPAVLDTLVDSEALFQVDTEKIWMPIQKRVLESLNEETHKGSQVLLYCLYLNWHNMKKELYTTFLVSEFQAGKE